MLAEGLSHLRAKPDIAEAEIFAAVNSILTCRINYTSHIPCNGLEEPKSVQTQGVGLRIAFKNGSASTVGFGQETGTLTLEGWSGIPQGPGGCRFDPDFHGLPATPSPGRTA